MKRIGVLRRKSRDKLKKDYRQRGKLSLTRYLQSFSEGDRVLLSVEPAVQTGMYGARFIGKSGVIKAKTGRCYEVSIMDGGKEKTIIAHPVHLKRL
jgi:large subunit ribosomal protein L21e